MSIFNINPALIQAVLFDMDGLMFNSEELYKKAIEKMADKRDKNFTNDMHRRMMGRSTAKSLAVLQDSWKINDSIKKLTDERDELVMKIADDEIKIMPGVTDIISWCIDVEIKHAIVTGSNKRVAEHFVKISGVGNKFMFILDGDQVKHGKPDPDIYLKAAKMIGEEPENCVALEDSLNGTISANRAGCIVISCPNEFSLDEDFSIADVVVGSLDELVPYLGFIR